VIEACGRLGIPLIRVMAPIGADGYFATEARLRAMYRELAPALRDSGVRLGVQNHSGRYVCHAMGLWRLLDGLDPGLFGAVWDPAHNALEGEEPDLALEIIGPRTFMVNLKNAFRRRVNGPEAEAAEWEIYWTGGRHGLASWPRVAELLRARGYAGVVCLPAEYSDEDAVDRLIVEDLHLARSLFAFETAASRNAGADS
jgi:sugar phosphate isomerase/epimerase